LQRHLQSLLLNVQFTWKFLIESGPGYRAQCLGVKLSLNLREENTLGTVHKFVFEHPAAVVHRFIYTGYQNTRNKDAIYAPPQKCGTQERTP
jgi:hypothetical protein